MSSLYKALADELRTAIEEHALFAGNAGDDKITAFWGEDTDYRTQVDSRIRKVSATVAIEFAFSRNEQPRSKDVKRRAIGFNLTLWTKTKMRHSRTTADELLQALEELIDGMESPVADSLLHCEHEWQWDATDAIPDESYLRWELAVSIKTRNPVTA